MKIFHSEFSRDYASYTFSYAAYAVAEPSDALSDIYGRGFLPYTGERAIHAPAELKEIYYLCRSLRVELKDFQLGSENRRVMRKFENDLIEIKLLPKSDYLNNEEFRKFCMSFSRIRFSGGELQESRWKYILSRDCGNHILQFNCGDKTLGYVLCGLDQNALHYWFAFYDIEWSAEKPMGKFMMTSAIIWAQSRGLSYIYLGTCYGPGALYKVRDFHGTSFFDGESWNEDMELLKHWCKTDDQDLLVDRFKSS